MWRTSDLNVRIIDTDRQFIHMNCELNGKPPFLMTAIYAIPHSHLRSTLWDKLEIFSYTITIPWVVYGDFNDILAVDERRGGARSNLNRIR